MRFHQVVVAALAAGVQAYATPLAKRQVTSDFDVLNYALTLVCFIIFLFRFHTL